MENFNVEKDVPVRRKWAELADNMGKGDSVLMSEKDMKCFREYMRRSEIMCLTRRNIDGPEHEAYRVWRRS